MASELEDKVNTQVFKVSALKTRSVTLYPTRAAVVRDIENVKIKPGRNEISIIGLSTLVDENTIKIEGHGTNALITDTVVEQVSNTHYDDETSEEEEEEGKEGGPECARLSQEIKELNSQIEDAQECSKSRSDQIAYMEQHAASLSSGKELATTTMVENMQVYGEFREKSWVEYKKAQKCVKSLQEKRDKKADEHRKEWKRWQRGTRGEKLRGLEKRNRPQLVRKVTVTIELDSLPKATEAVESYVSTGKPARADDDEPPKSRGPSLRISYVTTGASWSPRYDMRLDTTSETALLTYRAEFSNNTGETWTDAEVTLSTSQASFTGLEDKVPWLDSWRMSLQKDGDRARGRAAQLYSTKEKQLRHEEKRKKETPVVRYISTAGLCPESPQYAPPSPPPPPQPPATSGFFPSSSGPIHFHNFQQHSAIPPMAEQKMHKRLSGGGHGRARRFMSGRISSSDDSGDSEEEDSEADTIDFPRKMSLALSKSESYGLTTTYDLPGTRTIPSSRLARRHVIQELTLPNVKFSHISVPKLRAAAFLKARVTNSSATALLTGPCGLTVDGSFLGNSTVDRCAPGGTFDLSLGIDEEVLVGYRKPVKKMASHGMLSREQVVTYERSISVHNVKRKRVDVLLFDQVPVSENERLKVVLLTPRVREEGAMAYADYEAPSGGLMNVGRMLKKGGEIRFKVSLERGEGVVLPVEYETRFPMGEHIEQV